MKLLTFVAFFVLFSVGLNAFEIKKTALRASYESVKISPDEDMGLAGISYLFEPNKYFYYGASLYGTLSGKRGGFFVGGFNAGAKYPLYKNLQLDAGAFVGAGGGGAAPQGGGLMLKSYAGMLYEFNSGYSLGLNYSYITFPNGDIESAQASIVADMKFETLFVDTPLNTNLLKNYNFVNNKDYLVATFQTYMPQSGTKKVSGSALEENLKLVGIEYGFHLSENIITYMESAGALGGDSTGYMEVLGGLGYSQELTSAANVQAKLSLGSAGGGQVNSGGGAVSKASLNVNYDITKDITAGVGAGYYHAFEGNFDARFAKAQIGMNTHFLSLGSKKSSINLDMLGTQKFNVRISHQTYLYSDTLSPRDDGKPIQLIGVKLDWFVSQSLYISGQGLAAYKGGAGGYATGLFGIGYIQKLLYDFSLVAELNGGAAGGGSLETGSGTIVQPMAGLHYSIDNTVAIELMGGKIIATNGPLESNVVDLSIVYRFDKLVQK